MSIRWPRLLNANQLSQILKLQKNPLTALTIFNEVKSKFPDYRHNGAVYATMIDILGRSGKISAMNKVLDQMKDDSCELKDTVAASVMKTYTNAGMVDEAVSLFKSLPEFNCVNWTASFNFILETLVKESRLESFHRLFMENSGGWEVKSRIGSLNLLMDALCKIRRSDLALEVFQEMTIHCYFPNRETYGLLMRGLCEDGRLNDAIHLLYSMFWRVSQKGSGGDIEIYRTLLDTLCDHGQVSEAVEILRKVLLKGLKTPKSRRKLLNLDHIYENEDPRHAKALIHEALIKGAVPSTSGYMSMLTTLYSEGKIDQANKVLDEMRKKGYEPSQAIYLAKVAALCREGLSDKAAMVVEQEMLQWGCVPTTKVVNVAVKGLCEAGKSVTAVRILEKMVRIPGCAPNKETYTVMVEGLCRDGMVDEASEILERMVKKCWPEKNVFGGVIRGFCKKERRFEVVLWLEEMVSHGMLPDASLWNEIVRLFGCNRVEFDSICLDASQPHRTLEFYLQEAVKFCGTQWL